MILTWLCPQCLNRNYNHWYNCFACAAPKPVEEEKPSGPQFEQGKKR